MPIHTAQDVWRRIEASGARVVYRPVKRADVTEAERRLGVKLPPSYVELVRTLGAPGLAPVRSSLGKTAWNMPFAVLKPNEIVKNTVMLRKSLFAERLEQPEELPRIQAQLDNAVWFQNAGDPNDGFMFLIDSANARGEMRVADYAHDYVEELDWSAKSKLVFKSLFEATKHVEKLVERHLAAIARAIAEGG